MKKTFVKNIAYEGIVLLLKQYLHAFISSDIKALKACYILPCSLHTPDKIAYLRDEQSFNYEFNDIFNVLHSAKVKNIKALKASFESTTPELYSLCIDWAFVDDQDQIFTDFTGFFQVIKINERFKIAAIISHELSNSVNLAHELDINLINDMKT